MKYLKIYEEKKEEPIRKECLFCYVYITFTFKKYNNTYNENNKDIINILYSIGFGYYKTRTKYGLDVKLLLMIQLIIFFLYKYTSIYSSSIT